ncbi:hypothetical protein FV228_04330 [Methylobacterium sp. WL18]|uniref:hypothetical protein n=1 Tax=Methylobacterium sp. WL18 TaxID=2603897 RepID=UPI0011C7EC76|nr:hypothetical protein [Methylobacterium sp. WL18]TXN75091.1 hypothetical protein FV228_04330 [Methylobacterium sp. WL18]
MNALSPRPAKAGTPRPNHTVTLVSKDLAWIASDLDKAAKALAGREFIVASDVAELRRRIASATAAIAKVSAELASPASGMLVPGASNDHAAVEGGLRS